MLKGIDLSTYQFMNYKYYIDTYGTDFVITRAAWRFTVDTSCDPMYQYAKAKGKKLGFYFFPLSQDSTPERHAKWAADQVKGYIGEAIPFLDWEAYSGTNVADINWALKWLQTFEAETGVKPVIYMNSNCNQSYNWQPVIDNNNGLWIANYGINNGVDHGVPDVKWWSFAAIHQYTSLGNNGSGLDKDTFYGDKSAWDKYAKSSKTTKPDQKPNTSDQAKIKNLEDQIKNLETTIETLKKENQQKSESFRICNQNLTAIKSTYQKLVEMLKG